MNRRPCVRAIVGFLCVWLAVAPAHAFDVHRHYYMVQSGLEGRLDGNAMSAALTGVIYPDVSGCALDGYCDGWKRALRELCKGEVVGAVNEAAKSWILEKLHLDPAQPRPPAKAIRALAPDHFDDAKIVQGRHRAETRLGRARGILKRIGPTLDSAKERRDFVGALVVFGTVLHAVQDFYAHTNYAECRIRKGSTDVRKVPLWNGALRLKACESLTHDSKKDEDGALAPRALKGLVSGIYYGAGHKDEKGLFPDDANKTLHADINKDNPDPAAPQGARPVRESGDPRDLYAAVSGQVGDARDYDDPYTTLGLAVRHTQQAFDALVNGKPLFGTRAIAASDGAINPIRLTARSATNPIRQLLRNAATDTDVKIAISAMLGKSGLAGCALGPDGGEAVLRWFE